MNNVSICGKIISIKKVSEKVVFITVYCRNGKQKEYIDITIFKPEFFNRYFTQGMWISISGYLHKNKERDYRIEVIATNLGFAGDCRDLEFEQKYEGGQANVTDEQQDNFVDVTADETNLPF